MSGAGLTQEDRELLARFNPRMTYRVTRKVLREILLMTAPPWFYLGATWTVKSKHVGAGIYDVWSVMDGEEAKR